VTADVRVRSADLEDFEGIAAVAVATDQAGEGAGADPRYAGHLLSRGNLVVATDRDEVVGYAATTRIDDSDLLSDLFVLPQLHAQGIGRALLDEVWTDAPARMTFSSSHPSAVPLYLRYGLVPRWPVVYLAGDASALPPSSLVVDEVSSEQAAKIERKLGGGDRAVDYGYWTARPNARAVVVRTDLEDVAVGCIGGDGKERGLSHLRVGEPTAAADALLAVLHSTTGRLTVAAPGPISGVTTLISNGWRVLDIDLFAATRPGLVDPEVIFPHAGLL